MNGKKAKEPASTPGKVERSLSTSHHTSTLNQSDGNQGGQSSGGQSSGSTSAGSSQSSSDKRSGKS